MADLPALPFPDAEVRDRTKGRAGRAKVVGPGVARQRERLSPALERLTRAFEQGRLATTDEPAANPENVLVLEVAGELDTFAAAVGRVPGLEFLAEEARDRLEADGDFQAVDAEGRPRPYDRSLYVVASDATAWSQILGLWERFKSGDRMPHGKAAFGHLFGQLRELRTWDDRDRLEHTGVLEAWSRELAGRQDELVEFEVELWARRDERRRRDAVEGLAADLLEVGGEVLGDLYRPEIDYHGVLARVPAHRLLEAVADHQVRWLRCEHVRFFHAVGQFAAVVPEDRTADDAEATVATAPLPGDDPPRIALLDGVPVAGHQVLDGRLIVDDPDGFGEVTEVARRVHGTGMASVVVHGDLDAPGAPQPRRVYVRPILWDQAPAWLRAGREELPRDRLPVDVLQAAVMRMFEGERAAPDVRVVVLAIGDTVAQFDRFVSPMARLVDWLSTRYEVLFLVSAGNHLADLELPADLDAGNAQELQHEVLSALARERGRRRLLSPGEAINALTVGALHADAGGPVAAGLVDPLVSHDLPAVTSAMGGGIARSVKPEVLLPGGRQALRLEPGRDGGPLRATLALTTRPPGIRVAAPAAGRLDATVHDNGTSPATGLAGHHAGHILEVLEALRQRYGDRMPSPDLDAVLVKAALVHGTRWGTATPIVREANAAHAGRSWRDGVGHMIGYGGAPAAGEVLDCDGHRVTALAAARITEDLEHVYRFPLPSALASQRDRRRLTMTLAWLTPINPRHRSYRRAALKLVEAALPGGLVDRADVGTHTSRRGTLQHDVLEGAQAVPFTDGHVVEFAVSCRADAGQLAGAVPYAVLVTLETPDAVELPIYEQVQQGLRVPVALRT